MLKCCTQYVSKFGKLTIATGWEKLEISFKKIRDIKETFHAKIGTIKDRDGMDLKQK